MKRILNKIVKTLSVINDVRAVVLYGSFARGEATSRSDIDLLILITERKTGKEVQDKIIELEQKIGRNMQPTIRTLDELQKTDTGLLQNIFQEGKVLYLSGAADTDIPSAILLQQKPFFIYTFQLNILTQKEKAKFNRQLYEQTRKGYKYKGLLQELGGQKLSAGCVLVPYVERQKIEKFFKQFKVQFSLLKVWK
jgi:predicted nucleotidyltransferase